MKRVRPERPKVGTGPTVGYSPFTFAESGLHLSIRVQMTFELELLETLVSNRLHNHNNPPRTSNAVPPLP